jgi:hypothetical protein
MIPPADQGVIDELPSGKAEWLLDQGIQRGLGQAENQSTWDS